MRIPIVFSFDENILIPAGVCITSLLANAKNGVFYDIYILHAPTLTEKNIEDVKRLSEVYNNCSLTFFNMENYFNDTYEVRGITKAAYYRLLIPILIQDYDKVIYADVDVIFNSCLSDIYNEVCFDEEYIAAVNAAFTGINEKKYVKSLGLTSKTYINSGFLIFNLRASNIDKLVNDFKALTVNSYEYLDQDIINIVCENKIKYINPGYNSAQGLYKKSNTLQDNVLEVFSKEELNYVLDPVVIHYTGSKPWNSFCLRHDYWWEWYKKSIFFDQKYYFKRYYSQQQLHDKSFKDFLKIGIKKFLLKREI